MKMMRFVLPLLFALLYFNVEVSAQQGQKINFGQFIKTVASTGTPEAVTSTNLWVTAVTLTGIKAARTDNTGTVYVGFSATNDEQFFKITTGGEIVIQAEDGRLINLKNVYIDVLNNGDGVGVIYK